MAIPGSAGPFLLAQLEEEGGYEIERSLRFNSSDSAYLSRMPASAGNRKTWTLSLWLKRTKLGQSYEEIISNTNSSAVNGLYCGFTGDAFQVAQYTASFDWNLITRQVFRDTSSWGHLLVAADTTQATASNRIKVYWNGVQITSFSTETYPTQNLDINFNTAVLHAIGRFGSNTTGAYYANMYMADIHFIDGQALTPSSFGEFDTNGVWQPIDASGLTYGTNGFHLPFSDNSTAAALGTDTSGNGNNWTPVNLAIDTIGGTTNVSTVASSGWVAGGAPVNMVDGNTGTSYNALNGGVSFSSPVSAEFKIQHGRGVGGLCWNEFYDSSNNLIYQSPSRNYAAGELFTMGPYYVANVSKIISQSNASGSGSDGHGTGAFYINNKIINTNSTLPTSFTYPGNIGDNLVDSPTNYGTDTGAGGEVRGNYATLNPLDTTATLSNGSLDVTRSAVAAHLGTRATFGIASGKWYWEATYSAGGSESSSAIGVALRTWTETTYCGNTNSWSYHSNGNKYLSGSESSYGATYTTGDIIGIAFDADAGTITAYKNGTSQGQLTSGLTSGPYFPAASVFNASAWNFNFGQRPFAYTAPSGFKALCTTNLPEPTIADGSTVMDVALYTGNGSTQTISGLNFDPDLVWIKGRSGATDHALYDTVRTATKQLESNTTTAETTEATGLTAFATGGFSLGALAQVNTSSATYAAWTWDAGSSTVTNTDGSITSQVRANASAGFSVVTYTGTGADATVGHGLGVAAGLVIVKRRDTAANWQVRHTSIAAASSIQLNLTNAAASATTVWNSTAPSSTVFSVGTDATVNANTATYVAYCFAPVAGYSSFGSYTGNGSADGPFVYTGFRPRWVMIKASSAAGPHWMLIDSTRSNYNQTFNQLYANLANAELANNSALDLLSNGFKCRADTFGNINGSGSTYIYAAFAEHPFATSRAR